MFVPKRWLVPGSLSLVLLTCIMASAIAGLRAPPGGEGLGIAAVSPIAADTAAARMSDPALCQPAAEPAALSVEEQAGVLRYLEAIERNKLIVVEDNATNSGTIANSQFNDGGFGDIGVQWRDVQNSAPITNVHISGTGNHTTVIVGDDNVIVLDETPSTTVEPPLDSALVDTPVVEAPVVDAPAVAPDPVVPTTVTETPATVAPDASPA